MDAPVRRSREAGNQEGPPNGLILDAVISPCVLSEQH